MSRLSQKGTCKMNTSTLVIAALIIMAITPIGLYIYARFTAVEGYEDADGFHYGKQVKK